MPSPRSKVAAGGPEIFSVWSDEVARGRLDAKYWLPSIRELLRTVQNGKYKSRKLGEFITDIHYGVSTTNEYVESGIPLLRILNLKNDGLDLSDIVYLPEGQRKEIGRAFVKDGDMLISRSGSVGIVVEVPKKAEDFAFGSFMIKFRLNDEIDRQYVAAWMNSGAGHKLIEREKIGAIQGNITIETIKNFDIPVPPPKVQKEVVKKVQEAHEKKHALEAEIKKVLASIDSYVLGELGIGEVGGAASKALETFEVWSDELSERLDAPFYNPRLRRLLDAISATKHTTLDEAVADMSGGATPRVTGDYYSEDEGVPFLRVQNITEMGIDLDDVKYIKPEVHETMLKRSQLQKDDLVFTITGRVGSVAVVPEGFIGNINQHSVRLHLKSEVAGTKLLPQYVAAFFNTQAGRQLSLRYTTGGTRPALDYVSLKQLVFPLPTMKVQEKVVAGVAALYEKVRALRQEAEAIIAKAQQRVEAMILA